MEKKSKLKGWNYPPFLFFLKKVTIFYNIFPIFVFKGNSHTYLFVSIILLYLLTVLFTIAFFSNSSISLSSLFSVGLKISSFSFVISKYPLC